MDTDSEIAIDMDSQLNCTYALPICYNLCGINNYNCEVNW